MAVEAVQLEVSGPGSHYGEAVSAEVVEADSGLPAYVRHTAPYAGKENAVADAGDDDTEGVPGSKRRSTVPEHSDAADAAESKAADGAADILSADADGGERRGVMYRG